MTKTIRELVEFLGNENMKFACRNRKFWYKGYYVYTAGKNIKMIKEYIKNQLKQDKESDQLSFYAPKDPFKGGKY